MRCARLMGSAVAALGTLLVAAAAQAACTGPVAGLAGGIIRVATGGGEVGLTFLGHASFLIESPQGVTAVTDYNGYLRPPFTPDIVTMNVAHDTHYTDHPDPAIPYVLRGWDPAGGVPSHNLAVGDMRVRNIPTNIRDFGGTRYAANSMFIFDVAGLCIVHTGHLHHTLTPRHLADLGQVDVLLAAVDGSFTISHDDLVQVVRDIHPQILIPMHYFNERVLEHFLAKLDGYTVRRSRVASITLSRDTLPDRPEALILPGF